METIYCAEIKNWDGVIEQAKVSFNDSDVQLTYKDGITHLVKLKWYMDNRVGSICLCGATLNTQGEQHFGRCENHLPIFCPSTEEEFFNNMETEAKYKAELERWSN